MIPKSDLFGASLAAPQSAPSSLSPEYSPAPRMAGNDFFAMVSHAFTRNPDQPAVPSPSVAPYSSPQEKYDAVQNADDDESEDSQAAADASTAKDEQSSSVSVDKKDAIDSSVLSTLMAMLAQPGVPPADLRKLIPGHGKDLKIAAEQGAQGSDKSGGPAQSPATALVNGLAGPASKPAILAAMKSLTDAGKSSPANAPPTGKEVPPANPVQLPSPVPQLTALKDVPMAAQERLESAVPLDGMGTALNKQRMKFAAEKNEIAGRAVQKLPDASSPDDFSTDLAVKADVKSDPDLPGHAKDSFDPNLLFNLSAKSSMTDLMQGNLPEKAPSTDSAAIQAERVAHLVTQEVVLVRQSGANSLAVSLKVDSHTELFLQLTNHDGQIQASVRCERGNVEGLGSHWGQLQESLARQNVQLMPLEGTGLSRNSTNNPPPDNASPRAFDQSSQNPQRQTRDTREESSSASAAGESLASRKTKTNNRSRQGWESWA